MVQGGPEIQLGHARRDDVHQTEKLFVVPPSGGLETRDIAKNPPKGGGGGDPPASSQTVPTGVARIGAAPAAGASTGLGVGIAIRLRH